MEIHNKYNLIQHKKRVINHKFNRRREINFSLHFQTPVVRTASNELANASVSRPARQYNFTLLLLLSGYHRVLCNWGVCIALFLHVVVHSNYYACYAVKWFNLLRITHSTLMWSAWSVWTCYPDWHCWSVSSSSDWRDELLLLPSLNYLVLFASIMVQLTTNMLLPSYLFAAVAYFRRECDCCFTRRRASACLKSYKYLFDKLILSNARIDIRMKHSEVIINLCYGEFAVIL